MGDLSMRKIVIFLLSATIFLSILTPLTCFAEYNDSIELRSDIACVICTDNDEAIFNKNYNKRTAPASLTKIIGVCLNTLMFSKFLSGQSLYTLPAINHK